MFQEAPNIHLAKFVFLPNWLARETSIPTSPMAAQPETQVGNVTNAAAAAGANHPADEETPLLAGDDQQPDGNHEDEQESWYSPRINTWRFGSVNLTLLIMGMNDACVGVSFSCRTEKDECLLTWIRP